MEKKFNYFQDSIFATCFNNFTDAFWRKNFF